MSYDHFTDKEKVGTMFIEIEPGFEPKKGLFVWI